ncbi:MAG: ice-binding family protein, partial [Acholeplasmataceae bacterium]|nr:ice-binding family protein [Acholeplasmataceae bacterium]
SVSNSSVSSTMVITISGQEVVATSITVSGLGDATIIDVNGGTLQMSATVLPANAADKSVVWSVVNGTGLATISSSGLLTALSNGTVTVKATATNNALVFGTKEITISNQVIPVASVEVLTADNVSVIDVFGGTLQMNVLVLPGDATNKSVIWSIVSGTDSATISSEGLLTATANGSVTVKAAAASNALVYGTKVITISNQEVAVVSVEVLTAENVSVIDVFGGTLQMNVLVLPGNATDKSVLWSVEDGTGKATISSSGLLTAVANGTVMVKVTSASNALIFGTKEITISNQDILATSIDIQSAGDALVITTFGGTLQFTATVLPLDATNKSVIWSVTNGTGTATISVDGLLSAVTNGTVTVKAASATDPLIFDEMIITLSNQEVLVASITVAGYEGSSMINTFGGTLQMIATVLPLNAENKLVVWSVLNGTGEATISSNGLLTAVSNGTVTVTATSVENNQIFGSLEVMISNQEVLVQSIEVLSAEDSSVIDTFGGTLQFSVNVLPVNADDQSVIWSVENGTGEATIDEEGLLTAVSNGIVTVKATSVSNPSVFGTKQITLSNQEVVIPSEDPVNLLTAGDFTILAKTGISTAADSMITGNMGVSPAAATYITGFSLILDSSTQFATSAQVVGMIYASDYSVPTPAYLTQAVSDMEAAYVDAAGRAADFTELHAGDLSGQTLVGGVYKYGTDVVIYTNLTLSGSAEDVWIFQISGTLNQAVSVQIILSGGALAENVFWQVAGNVAIETSAHFVGTILSMTEISLGTGATVNGRLLSQTAVTLDANAVGQEVLVQVDSVVVTSFEDAIEINTFGGTLQMFAEVLPNDATNKAVIWSVQSGTGSASISENGLLSALSDGTVIVKATSVTDPLLFDTMEITLSNQTVLVSSISLSGAEDAVVINTFGGTLQIAALVLPADAENKAVVWSVENVSGEALISETGLLTAVANGTVVVKATSVENSEIFGTLEITISNQEILADEIIVTSDGDVVIIDVDKATLQMYAEVLPVDADDKLYTWSVVNVSGQATISETGLLSAVADGTVLVKATLNSDPLVFGSLEITISNQEEVIISGGVELLTAGEFTILAKTGISTTAGTHINGNLGVSPAAAAAITGFGLIMDSSGEFATSALVTGMIYAADYSVPTPSYLSTAIGHMEAAYTDAASRTPDYTELYAGDISGQTLVPGVYKWSSGLLINTDVTLAGNATDVWIFQISGTLTQATDASVLLSGGALASNIVWQVAAAVSIGVGAHFEGTILGMTSVNLGTGATYNGKIFAQTAVTLDDNDIN